MAPKMFPTLLTKKRVQREEHVDYMFGSFASLLGEEGEDDDYDQRMINRSRATKDKSPKLTPQKKEGKEQQKKFDEQEPVLQEEEKSGEKDDNVVFEVTVNENEDVFSASDISAWERHKRSKVSKYQFFSSPISRDGKLMGVGRNVSDQLAVGSRKKWQEPVEISFVQKIGVSVHHVSCGYDHSAFLMRNGDVYTAGKNRFGELCREHNDKKVRVVDKYNHEVQMYAVSCGGIHTVFLTRDKEIYAGGGNCYGQLGVGDFEERSRPVFVRTPEKMESVECGWHQTYYLSKSGKLYVAGFNNYGSLGTGDTMPCSKLTEIKLFRNKKIESLQVGYYHAVVSLRNGEVFSTGRNDAGQLGLGDKNHRYAWERVRRMFGKRVIVGANHTLMKVHNSYYVFGNNFHAIDGAKIIPKNHYKMIRKFVSLVVEDVICGNGVTFFIANNTVFANGSVGESVTKHLRNIKIFNHSIARNTLMKKNVERFDVMIEDDESKDLNIFFGGSCISFDCFKSFFIGSQTFKQIDENGELKVGKSCTFDEGNALKMMFAVDFSDEFDYPSVLFGLYNFCGLLNLELYQYVILNEIQLTIDINLIIGLLAKSFQALEPELYELFITKPPDFSMKRHLKNFKKSLKFKDAFNLNLFNMLKDRTDEIYPKKLPQELKNLPEALKNYDQIHVSKHKMFKKAKIPSESISFEWLYNQRLFKLYEVREKFGNLIITSKDMKQIRCTREIIMVESDYFYMVLKHDFRESSTLEGFLILERLNYDELMLLIEFVYTKDIIFKKKHVYPAFALLVELQPYRDDDLKYLLTDDLLSETEKMIKKGNFVESLPKILEYFNEYLPVEVHKRFLRRWNVASKVHRDTKLMKIIENILNQYKENE